MAGRAKENFPRGSLKYLFVYLKVRIFKCSYRIHISPLYSHCIRNMCVYLLYIYTYLYDTPPRYNPIIFTVYPSVTSPLRYLLLSAVPRTTSSSGRGWWTTPGLHGLRRSSTSACRRLERRDVDVVAPAQGMFFLGSFPTWWNLAIPTFSLWW